MEWIAGSKLHNFFYQDCTTTIFLQIFDERTCSSIKCPMTFWSKYGERVNGRRLAKSKTTFSLMPADGSDGGGSAVSKLASVCENTSCCD